MQTYEIPRNYKGESRILYIFSTRALIFTAIGAAIGLIPYFILQLIGLNMVGIIIVILFGAIGFSIATFKIPELKKFEITKSIGGESIEEVIRRWIKFQKKKNKIYVYMKEDTKDE